MSDSFGTAACGLFGIAARLLGWTPATFWTATPAELIAALAPAQALRGLDRADLTRMMDNEHG